MSVCLSSIFFGFTLWGHNEHPWAAAPPTSSRPFSFCLTDFPQLIRGSDWSEREKRCRVQRVCPGETSENQRMNKNRVYLRLLLLLLSCAHLMCAICGEEDRFQITVNQKEGVAADVDVDKKNPNIYSAETKWDFEPFQWSKILTCQHFLFALVLRSPINPDPVENHGQHCIVLCQKKKKTDSRSPILNNRHILVVFYHVVHCVNMC